MTYMQGTSQALQKAVNSILQQQVKPGGDIKAAKVGMIPIFVSVQLPGMLQVMSVSAHLG